MSKFDEPEDKSHILTVAEILNNNAEDIKWDVANLWPEGSLVLLTAPPASFKTLLTLDAA